MRVEGGNVKQKGLKVPKHEIFDGGFFASKELTWSPDS
jgi:hypothetical protein